MAASRTSLRLHFQTGRKGEAQDRVVAGMAHHLVPKMVDMLYRITYLRVVIEYQSGERLWELALLDLFGEERLVDLGSRSRVIQQYCLSDPLLDQFVEGAEVRRPAVLRAALHLHWVVLEGRDLSQELLVE